MESHNYLSPGSYEGCGDPERAKRRWSGVRQNQHGKHVVIAIIDNQLKGADLVGGTTPTIHLLCAILDGELLISEADLLIHANRLVDLQHGSHDVLVGCFVSANQVHFVLKLFDLIVTAQIFNGCKQMFFLTLGDEFGSTDTLSQEAKLFTRIWA